MNLLTVWFVIVGCLLLFGAIIVPATARLKAENRDRLSALMDAHERNLQSDDPQVVADSKRRWAVMVDFVKRNRGTYEHGCILEDFGRAAERRHCKASA